MPFDVVKRGKYGKYQALRALYSSVSILFLKEIPPGAEKPPILPSVRSTRWQGIIRGNGLLARALPTARLAECRPAFFANQA